MSARPHKKNDSIGLKFSLAKTTYSYIWLIEFWLLSVFCKCSLAQKKKYSTKSLFYLTQAPPSTSSLLGHGTCANVSTPGSKSAAISQCAASTCLREDHPLTWGRCPTKHDVNPLCQATSQATPRIHPQRGKCSENIIAEMTSTLIL